VRFNRKQSNSGNLISPGDEAPAERSNVSPDNTTNDPLIGQTVGKHYQILACCGKGGMSTVYKAKDLTMGNLVAIKFLLFEGKTAREQMMLRFQREARVVGSLDHPNVIAVHAFDFTADRQPFLVMDYAEGETLAERIARTGRIPLDQCIDIFIQICDGLAHAHEKGVLHRDLKPGNVILLDERYGDVTLKILDFGIAKLVDNSASNTQQLTRTGDVFGSPLYMSPEQGLGKSLTASSDLYSLGCLMFEALTGLPPFMGKTAVETILKHQTEAPPTLMQATLGEEFPQKLENIVSTLLAKEARDRFQSALELGIALRDLKKSGDAAIPVASNNAFSKALMPERSRMVMGATQAIAFVSIVILLVRILSPSKHLVQNSTPPINDNAPAEQIIRELPKLSAQERADTQVAYEAKYTPGVKSVDYRGYKLSLQGFSEIAKLKRLSNLNLSDTPADDAAVRSFVDLRELNALVLSRTKLTDEGVKTIAGLHLGLLDLSYTNISNRTLEILASKMPGVQNLFLSGTQIDDDGMEALGRLKSLYILDLCQTKITDKGLEPLSQLTDMEELNLARTKVSNAGLIHLKNLKSLSCLELSETSVTDAGLSALTSLKKLKFLGLKKTRITNAGLSSLVRIPSLRKLILDDTLITDEGLSTLLKMNNPSYLHLRGCKGVSNQGLLKLKAAFPNCEINSTAYAGNSTSADGNIPYDVNSHSTDANARDRGGNSGKSDNDSSSNEKDGGSTGGSFGTSDSTG
jgi:serine/threonine protein kinase